MIYFVPPQDHAAVWPTVAPMIEKALKRSNGTYDVADVAQFLSMGKMHLWCAVYEDKVVAAFITEIVIYPQKKALRLVFGGGSHLHEWAQALHDEMRLRAKEIGADLLEVHGRKGWMRVLKNMFGCKTETVIMTEKIA